MTSEARSSVSRHLQWESKHANGGKTLAHGWDVESGCEPAQPYWSAAGPFRLVPASSTLQLIG